MIWSLPACAWVRFGVLNPGFRSVIETEALEDREPILQGNWGVDGNAFKTLTTSTCSN